VSKITKDS